MKNLAWILMLVAVSTVDAQPPKMRELPGGTKPFKYVDARLPFYAAGGKGGAVEKTVIPMQLPLEPAQSLQRMSTPVDLEVQLVAAEPDIRRPICMNWDERGRLWIAESLDYPNDLKPEGKGNDRIVICQDSDGDGKMDSFTVFADKLSIPTGFTFAQGGVVVHQAPHTLLLRDTDGDDRADERKVLFSGWSTGDTHAGPSNLHYGLDNWLWGVVGYAGFKGNIGKEKQDFRTGLYRFKPDGSKFEFLRNTSNNTWGLGFSEEGLVFASTANGNPSVYLPIPNRFYESVRGWSSSVLGTIAESNKFYPVTDKVRQVDFHGGFTAGAGHALYTARLYPKVYWNRTAFVAEPTGHLVATFQIERKGSDFASRNAWNLLASDDEWTSPTMAEIGPDGCVWIIDWYNYIIQHNPTPAGFKTGKGNAYETPLRDRKHGRIIRLVPVGARLPASLNLRDASPAELVAALTNDNLFWRRHAQRLLVERGNSDVTPALVKLIEDESTDALGLNPGALHALWTLHGLGALQDPKATVVPRVAAALRHRSAAVRRGAVMVLPRHRSTFALLQKAGVLEDPDAHVRLAALLALSEIDADVDLTDLVRAFRAKNNWEDRWLADALVIAAARHAEGFLVALARDRSAFPTPAREKLSIIVEHYARSRVPGQSAEPVLAAWSDRDSPDLELLLRGLVKGWPKGISTKASEEIDRILQRSWARLSAGGKSDLLRLSKLWGLGGLDLLAGELTRSLWATLESEKESTNVRAQAAKQLVELSPRDAKTVERLLGNLSPRTPPELAEGLLNALTASTTPEVGPLLLRQMETLSPALKTGVLRVLFSKTETTMALLDAFQAGRASSADLSLDQKQALLSHPDRKIAARAKKVLAGAGLPSPDRQKVIETFLPLLAKKANADAGKLHFKKHCAVCHTHGGEGNKVGPDLTGMAVHPKAELLVHVLDPSRSVEGNYRLYTVSTLDGRFFNGMLLSESKTAIELVDPQAKKQVLQREDIDTLQATPKSLMPEGFEKQLGEQELLDLLEFLTLRGKYFTLPLDRVANVVSTQGMFITKEAPEQRLILPEWSTRTVKGVPFHLIDPRGDRIPNVLMLYGPSGYLPPKMPRAVRLPCNAPAAAIHFLSGISGWGYPSTTKGSVALRVRLHYDGGKTEDHDLLNGVHFADYIRRIDVPGSQFAFAMRSQQMRYLSITPRRDEAIREIELIKPKDDPSAPVVLAVTVESRHHTP